MRKIFRYLRSLKDFKMCIFNASLFHFHHSFLSHSPMTLLIEIFYIFNTIILETYIEFIQVWDLNWKSMSVCLWYRCLEVKKCLGRFWKIIRHANFFIPQLLLDLLKLILWSIRRFHSFDLKSPWPNTIWMTVYVSRMSIFYFQIFKKNAIICLTIVYWVEISCKGYTINWVSGEILESFIFT